MQLIGWTNTRFISSAQLVRVGRRDLAGTFVHAGANKITVRLAETTNTTYRFYAASIVLRRNY